MTTSIGKKTAAIVMSVFKALGLVGIGVSQAHAVPKYGYMCSYDISRIWRAAQTKSNGCAEAQPRVFYRTSLGNREWIDGAMGAGTRTSPVVPTHLTLDGYAGRALNLGVTSSWQEI